MAEYLDGGRIQGTSTLASSPPQTSWKVLGRSSAISSTATDIDVSITAKDNMMIFGNFITNSTQVDSRLHFNDDGGSGGSTNYAWRIKNNNSSESDSDETYGFNTEEGYFKNAFQVYNVFSRSTLEKLITWHSVHDANTTGSGTAPTKLEGAGKWVNTSSDITKVSFTNIDSGSYYAGSEVVVIGCDNDEADSGTNFWEQLADVTLTSATSTLDSGTISVKKYLKVRVHFPTGSGFEPDMRFNGSSANDYCTRFTGSPYSGGTGTNTSVNSDKINGYGGTATTGTMFDFNIVNVSGNEKLVFGHIAYGASGVGNANDRREIVGKWDITNTAITSIQFYSSGSIPVGTRITVWGAD